MVYIVEVGFYSEVAGVFEDEGMAQKYAEYRNGSVRKMEMMHTSPTGRGWVVHCTKTAVLTCKRCDGAAVIPWEAEIEMFRRKKLEHDSWYFTVFATDEYSAKKTAVEHRAFLLKEGLW